VNFKILFIPVIPLLVSIPSCKDPSGYTLNILENNYPRAFFFRIPQFTHEPYGAWENDYRQLMGIEGKVLEEELPGISDPNIDYFTRFKHNHPAQCVLLHYNGNARDPRNDTEDFFAGHWLYYNGAGVLSDLPAGDSITRLKVSDVTLFRTHTGPYRDRNEDLGICALDDSGKPDWKRSEQVRLVSMDEASSTIVVHRGCYNTSPLAFQAGRTYIASHVQSGPYEEYGNLMWFYNHSLECPRDASGRICVDVLVQDIAAHFLQGGDLEAFDGIEFDVLVYKLAKHHNLLRNYTPGSNRAPDTNADGIQDNGVFGGIDTYGEGVMKFLRDLREMLGDEKLIMADHNSGYHQRAFGIINGIECEGWPLARDYRMKSWSGSMNRLYFWDRNARAPGMNYINHKWFPRMLDTVDVPISSDRLVMAVSCLSNFAIGEGFYLPEREPGQSGPPIWDELVMGRSNTPGWLGKPLGPSIRLAKKEENIFHGQSLKDLMQRIVPAGESPVSVAWDGNAIRIEGKTPHHSEYVEVLLKDIPGNGQDLTIFMTFSGRSLTNKSTECGRIYYVIPEMNTIPYQERWYISYFNQSPFESVFYYPDLPEGNLNFRIKIEGGEALRIHSLEAYACPDAMVREFENGIVLANPAPHHVWFNTEGIFPDRSFMRLQGSASQDPVTNNGTRITGGVQVGPKDGLFLRSDPGS